MIDRGRGWPVLTLTLVGAALVLSLDPRFAGGLEYDRGQIAAGEYWRLFTGQLVHWTPRMAAVDLAVVLLLGAWLERRRRLDLIAAVASGVLVVGAGIHGLAGGIQVYRGASGVAATLFVVVVARVLQATPDRAPRRLAAAMLAMFAVKLVWETTRGTALFAGPLPAGIVALPLAHLLGAAAGVVVAGWTATSIRSPVSAMSPSPRFGSDRAIASGRTCPPGALSRESSVT